MAIMQLVDKINNAVEKKRNYRGWLGVYQELSKAFDTIHYTMTLYYYESKNKTKQNTQSLDGSHI